MRFQNESLCELENKVELNAERNSVHVEIFKNKNSAINKPRYNPKNTSANIYLESNSII